ncbi:DNA-binding transcriptional ArsR family regulator [Nocardia sp. GAS34]|uniref:hypothetical protein n=1 Tax=unclassified Nocardia TaxID=2637762 RepID=UPI003D2312DA
MPAQTHYWDAIVGDNWPAIGPDRWGTLETTLREAASTVDVDGLESARRDFDERVRASAALQPVKDAMAAHQGDSRELVDAVAAAADLLRDFAALANRTRNRILDIVDDALASIAGITEKSAGKQARIGQVHDIVTAARERVEAAVSGAPHEVDPPWSGLRARITELAVSHHLPALNSAGISQVPAMHVLDRRGADSSATDPAGDPADGSAAAVATLPMSARLSRDPALSQGGSHHPTPTLADLGDAAPAYPGVADDVGSVVAAAPRDVLPDTGGPSSVTAPDPADVAPDPAEVTPDTADGGAIPMPVVFLPQDPTPATPSETVASANKSEEVSPYVRSLERVTADPMGDQGSAAESGTAGEPQRGATAEGAAGRPRLSGHDSIAAKPGSGSAAMIRSVVGDAMAAAAGPVFEVGGRGVDGHLILARTILAGILAAVESSWYGIGFAVAVLRRPGGGVIGLVASNEGRGWLPAGLYLPQELSTPWRWSEARHSGWEGISDPARILAEFVLERGSRSDARLAALVSSEPIDAGIRWQLGEVALEGRVAASAALPLDAPAPGLVDRLGLVISPANQARLDRIPLAAITARCADLARDAHQRVARTGAGTAATLGAPALRQRLLDTLRRGGDIPPNWWDELRDIDDLLAATVLTKRIDVTRIPLGELRSGRPGAEVSTLRSMVVQRRANELALLLANAPDRRMLRDAVYAHGQLTAQLSGVARPPVVPVAGKKTQ